MEANTRVLVEHNVFKGNGWAPKQANCDAVNVVHNNFSGNSFDISTSGTLVMNTFNSNYWDKYQGYDLNKDKIGDVPLPPGKHVLYVGGEKPHGNDALQKFYCNADGQNRKSIARHYP